MDSGLNPNDFICPKELQEWLGIKKTFCHMLLSSGQIRSYKIGKLRRIMVGDVLTWLEANEYRPGE